MIKHFLRDEIEENKWVTKKITILFNAKTPKRFNC